MSPSQPSPSQPSSSQPSSSQASSSQPAPTPPAVAGPVRPRVLVVGSGFAGFHCLRRLERRLVPADAELVLVSPTDYLLYSPLLPEVATGAIEPRHIAVPLRQHLRRTRLVLGRVVALDLPGGSATVLPSTPGGGDAEPMTLRWDRLVLTPGSVTKQLDIPGVADTAYGLKTIGEAVFLRDHVLAQFDLADVCADDEAGRQERRERLTVVAVGAGYTGTEFVAQMQGWLTTIARRWVRTGPDDVRWVLVDSAPVVLPELGPRLGRAALDLLHRRGVDARLGVSVASATDRLVRLTDGTDVACRTLVWGAGVAPSPLIATLGLPTRKGRLVVDEQLRVPDAVHVWAAGDAAAVPDLTRPRELGEHPATSPTAQHAQRQGVTLARNVAATFGLGRARRYRHPDLGLVADLGGRDAVARPLGVPLTGRIAKVVARGYHLYALPGAANTCRVGVDWLLNAVLPTQVVQLSTMRSADALIGNAQATGIYGGRDARPTAADQAGD